jgi:hypothetical protein
MAHNGAEEKSGRELRLLLLVIAVAIAVLLVLSRLRYPSADLAGVAPTPGPLERLVARPPFEELAAAIADLAPRVTTSSIIIELERTVQKPERKSTAGQPAPVPERRFVAALRVRPDLALAYVPAGMHVASIRGMSGSVQVVIADARRELVLLRVPPSSDAPDVANAVTDVAAPTYVAAVEGAVGGPAVRPVFIARTDAMPDARWTMPLTRIGGEAHVAPGIFLFTLQGRLIGLIVPQDTGLAIVPGGDLDRAVTDLLAGVGGQ